jgi:hypothetical protein
MDVAMQNEAEACLGELLHEAIIPDSIFVGPAESVVPHSDLEPSGVLGALADTSECVCHRLGVNARP